MKDQIETVVVRRQLSNHREGRLAERIGKTPSGERFLERMKFLSSPQAQRRPMPAWLRRDGE